MKLLFELNHPAHGHLFKNIIRQLVSGGHKVTVYVKEINILKEILDDADIEYISLGRKGKSLFSKGLKQTGFLAKAVLGQLLEKHDIGVGVSVTIPLLTRLRLIESIVLDDDDRAATPQFAVATHRNASTLLRPAILSSEGSFQNTVYYYGYHELAYLHPSEFSAQKSVLRQQGLDDDEPFFILRLVSLTAHHDRKISGLDNDKIEQLYNLLRTKGRIIASVESAKHLPEGIEPMKVRSSRMHHLMAFSSLVISDGQTMCSEAACLGVPSVRINDFVGRISYLEEQERRWKLTFGFKTAQFDKALIKISEILKEDPLVFKHRRDNMIANSIRVKDFIVWFIENYPDSHRIMKENPDYQYNFR